MRLRALRELAEQPVTIPLEHSTKENGDCPNWCKACAAEAKQCTLLEANE
ncbi:hypothetical protein GCM10027514_31210 [Azotobacter armeniacus]